MSDPTDSPDFATGVVDMKSGVDFKTSIDLTTTVKGPTGAPCTVAADCLGGTCVTGGAFVGGYCTNPCASNASCDTDSGESCIPGLVNGGGGCAAGCFAADACRAGYACWIGWNCFPLPTATATSVLCDPATNTGCATGQACQRLIHTDGTSTAKAGSCVNTCVVGTGTCPDTGSGASTCALFDNSTVVKADAMDLTDTYADKGVYLTCVAQIAGPKANGTTCTESAGTTSGDYGTACIDGSECAVSSRAFSDDTTPPLTSGADDLCHPLCYLSGAPSSSSVGTVRTACPVSTTCTDVFGLGSNTAGSPKIGLCK